MVNAMTSGKSIKHAIIAFQQIHLKLKKDYAKIEFCNDSCFGNPQLLVEKSYRELLANNL